ncbi:TIGR03085 family metal-binding protein [Brevibacterium samyangense]|uniref:TIGR03085 family metal-binding protein n=1 Tax=Brevibacterium samyangense TaxID=366888 RepID=A0ABP5ELB2_9MICO
MTDFARSERLALTALLREVGPSAPTLCEGWTTEDLAIHLVVRDRFPTALPGNTAPGAVGRFPRLLARTESAEARLRSLAWEELVGLVGEGEPWWSPAGLPPVRELVNGTELLVHHEDVRRAQDEWAPRVLSDAHQRSAWNTVRMFARMSALRSGTRYALTALTPSGGVLETVECGRGTAGGSVELRGEPLELLLWFFGRKDHALLDGD